MNFVAFTRDLRYWRQVLHGVYLSPNQPKYALKASTIPGWLVQTRSTYLLKFVGHSAAANLLFAGLIPAAAAVVMIIGARRSRVAWVVCPLIASCALLAVYAGSRRIAGTNTTCSYCIDRNLLPVTPVVVFLIALGIGTLAVSSHALVRRGAAAGAALLVAVTGYAVFKELQLFSSGSFFLDTSVASVMGHYPSGARPLELEGFNEGPNVWAEQPIVAYAAEERSWGHSSLADDYSDNDALAYVGVQQLSDPQFRPDYGYVLTRIAGVTVDRQLVARAGGIALQRRVGDLDVTVDSGVVVGSQQSNGRGRARVNPWSPEPMQFIVTGSGRSKVAVRIVLRVAAGNVPKVSSRTGHGLAVRRHDGRVDVCVEPAGTGPIRTVDVAVKPKADIELVSMTVGAGECAPSTEP